MLNSVVAALDGTGAAWAWQGAAGAPDRWVADTGPADLDVWWAADRRRADPVAALARAHAGAVVADAADPRRLRHTGFAVLTDGGLAVVDVTHGDLRVGPVLLMPAAEVTFDPVAHRLTGAAAFADLLVRPVLRGRIPGPERLAEAAVAWAAAEPDRRSRMAWRLTRQLGAAVTSDLIAIAEGAEPDPGLPRRARLRLAARSVAPGAFGSTWAQRRAVLPAGRFAGPLGLRTRGVVVALVGTDGAGKSTVAAALDTRLRGLGFTTDAAYFGMARGNLPGVALARRLLGVGSTEPSEPPSGTAGPAGSASDPAGAGGLDHPGLRRVAAWYYAGEYGWRYLRSVLPALARGRVVIADRWVYDLRESPWPGSPAARVAEMLVPAPDLLVLPDAPAEVIHRRKPERALADQRDQQERFHQLLAERPARRAEMLVDTAGSAADDGMTALVAAVVEAAHSPRDSRR